MLKYRLIESKKPEFPVRDLLEVKDSDLIVARKAFGPDYFSKNILEMQESYLYPDTGKRISFRAPTTAESIEVSACAIDLVKPEIFDPRWLQMGQHVKAKDAIYFNPPKDERGKPIMDEGILRLLKDQAEEVNGIWLGENGFSVVPYDFDQGVLESGKFAEQSLARGLEHTKNKTAERFAKISSKKLYPNGVNVWGWNSNKKPISRLSCLDSNDGQLHVSGNYWGDDGGDCFGVLE